VLGLCFGLCLLVVKLEYSRVLGDFLIGAIMDESRELLKIERLIEPVRDMISGIFFVAIRLMIDPNILLEYAWPIAVITEAVELGKKKSCGLG
ncbi:cation:proton antiporter, partial [Pseudomonas syringae pv. tagetis]|uniref:cation:proton antiporter domain-containing protein n=1 Tax=Pseudomonas syringae group genomosp. 7 TaxID=251699 RepID=UPI00376FEE86